MSTTNSLTKSNHVSKQTNYKGPRERWDDKTKARAVVIYKSVGSLLQTSEVSGIPYKTVLYWSKQEWWKERILQIQSEDTLQLADAVTNIAKTGVKIAQERLENGDFVLNKDGELIRKPVSAKDAALITSIAITKRKELNEEPQRIEQLSVNERLLKLVADFSKYSQAKEINAVARVVSDLALSHDSNIEEGDIIDAEQITEAGEDDGGGSALS